MNFTLYVAREVKVYIGRFIAVEAEEGFKRYIVPLVYKLFAAYGAIPVGQVESGANSTIRIKFRKMTFGAIIVRRQGVNLRNTAHGGNE